MTMKDNELKHLNLPENKNARNLLIEIKKIHDQGFIPTVINGDTGVGMTLESELNIKPNNQQEPDYNGIEIKAFRKKRSNNKQKRINFFFFFSNWKNSYYKSSRELLDNFGHWDEERNRIGLSGTLRANAPNPIGLYLSVDENNDKLYVLHEEKNILEWDLNTLKEILIKKHPETFWVEAEQKKINGVEYFKYNKIIYTQNPDTDIFVQLINSQDISLDYDFNLNEKEFKDHGYLFKIFTDKLNLIFPKMEVYDLDKLTIE